MEINVYKQCPCHPEKKIKFCCGKEIVGELNLALDKLNAEQPHAALDLIRRAVTRAGERDCLVTLQIQTLIGLNEFAEAEAVNDRFRERNPGHYMGLLNRALIGAGQGKLMESVEYLQDAIDSLPGAAIPISFSRAFQQVGALLQLSNYGLAAREYFYAAYRLNPENEMARHAAIQLSTGARDKALIRFRFALSPAPPGDAPWIRKYENVLRAIKRGQFRKARQIMDKVLALAPQDPWLLKQAAYLSTYFPDPDAIVLAFRRHAECTAEDLFERIDSAAISQLLSPVQTRTLPVVSVTYQVDDWEALVTAVQDANDLEDIGVDRHNSPDGQPLPRFRFQQYDGPKVADSPELHGRDLPRLVGLIDLYGRQTDREPRLVWSGVQSGRFDEIQQRVARLPGLSNQPPELQTQGQQSEWVYEMSLWNFLPHDLSLERRQVLVQQAALHKYQTVWRDLPQPAFDMKTPREAATLPEYELAARAMIFRLELMNYELGGRELAQELESQFGLAPLVQKPLSLGQVSYTLSAIHYGDFRELSAKELNAIFKMCIPAQLNAALVRAGLALLQMEPDSEESLSKTFIYAVLAAAVDDDAKMIEWFAQARREALKEQIPIGRILISELNQRLRRGITDEPTARLMHEIQAHHLQDEGIRREFFEVLDHYGFINRDAGQELTPGSQSAVDPVEEKTRMSPAKGRGNPASSSGGSKLWLPGT